MSDRIPLVSKVTLDGYIMVIFVSIIFLSSSLNRSAESHPLLNPEQDSGVSCQRKCPPM